MSYNKNVNNQSGLSVDNINVNTLATLPKSTIIDSVNGLTFTGGSSFSSVVVANGGIQLPSTSYTIGTNYLGYQPIVNLQNNRLVNPYGVTNWMASVSLTPGTYILRGQIHIFGYAFSTIDSSFVSISNDSANINLFNTNGYSKINQSDALPEGGSMYQEVSSIVTVASTTTYYLLSYLTFVPGGGVVLKSKNVSVTGTTINSAQSGTAIKLTAYDSTIATGMNVTGSGIVQGCYVISLTSDTFLLTFTTTQTVAANTILTFSHTNCATNLSVVRIA